MGGYPETRSLAREAQKQLADFNGLHMTPLDWLHISTLVLGSTDDITPDNMDNLLARASESLVGTSPALITLNRIMYHPEAIMVSAEPIEALSPLLDAARAASRTVLNQDGYTTSGRGSWLPHMTLCYSTEDQPAAPLIDALGLDLPGCTVAVNTLSLVVQWGPERCWKWQPLGHIKLTGDS